MEMRKQASRKPTQKRSIQRVEAILNATMECVLKIGLSEIKMKDISESARVSPSSVYQYFPDKQAIVDALADRSISEVQQCFEQPITTSTSGPEEAMEHFEEVLRQTLARYHALLVAKPALQALISSLALDPSLLVHNEKICAVRRAFFQRLLNSIASEWPSGEDFILFCHWAQNVAHSSVSLALSSDTQQQQKILDLTCASILLATNNRND